MKLNIEYVNSEDSVVYDKDSKREEKYKKGNLTRMLKMTLEGSYEANSFVPIHKV